MITRRSAVVDDLLGHEDRERKRESIGDPLRKIVTIVDFAALARGLNGRFPRADGSDNHGVSTITLRTQEG